jgi:hypothetical protein
MGQDELKVKGVGDGDVELSVLPKRYIQVANHFLIWQRQHITKSSPRLT